MSNFQISHHMQRDAIEIAIKELSISRNELCEVGKNQWLNIIEKTVKKFVTIDNFKNKNDLHWAWLKFKEPVETITFSDDCAYKLLDTRIDDDFVWFIVEDTFDKMWVYKAKASILPIILV